MADGGTQDKFIAFEIVAFAFEAAEHASNVGRHRGFLGDDQFFAGRGNNFRCDFCGCFFCDGMFLLFCGGFRWHRWLVTKVTTIGRVKRAADDKNKLLPKQAALSPTPQTGGGFARGRSANALVLVAR
mgnify:CR=1 FL=1